MYIIIKTRSSNNGCPFSPETNMIGERVGSTLETVDYSGFLSDTRGLLSSGEFVRFESFRDNYAGAVVVCVVIHISNAKNPRKFGS